MNKMSVYLDYNASAPIDSRVLDRMIDVYKNSIGNADSRTHEFGDKARSVVENSRGQVSKLIDVSPDEVFFTSGATESNNIAILGLYEYGLEVNKKHIITTAIEHKSVLETVKEMERRGFDIDYVKPDQSGRISAGSILDLVRDDTLLVSVMHVNNETGIIQPVKEIGELLKEKDVFFHIDATQSFGKLVDEIRGLSYNMLSFSAHKLQGPQGVGGLVLRKNRYKLPPIKPIMFGGQQEHGIRPGTIPVALVAGCGMACELAYKEYTKNNEVIVDVKESILNLFENSGLNYELNGDSNYCIPSTINISIKGVASEALMIITKQFCGISNGSACTSKSYSLSYVLTSMGLSTERIESAIRISWGADSKKESVIAGIKELITEAKELLQ